MNEQLYSGEGVVIRIGELFLKKGNRNLFMKALVSNVKRALAGRDVKVVTGIGRIFIVGAADEDVLERLRFVFGISSYSKVVFCNKNIDSICQTAVSLAQKYNGNAQTTFRIAPRRSDKAFEKNSNQIGIEAGSAVNIATGYQVDLKTPDLSIGVEVGKTWTFLWSQQVKGPGGLPVGTSGQVALLLSGGIDSPVAGHLLQKRGVALDCIYFHAFPYTSEGAKNKVVALASQLAKRQKSLRLYVVSFARVQEVLRDSVPASYLVLLYRRAMMKIAHRLVNKKVAAIATGESLGQVASQTLENLAVVESASQLPILRPLLTMDKIETIDLAKVIGTYDISIEPFEDCCTLFVPAHPETKGSSAKALFFENKVNWEDTIDQAVEQVEIIDL